MDQDEEPLVRTGVWYLIKMTVALLWVRTVVMPQEIGPQHSNVTASRRLSCPFYLMHSMQLLHIVVLVQPLHLDLNLPAYALFSVLSG